MKKAFIGILAVLTVCAMTMVSCGGGSSSPGPGPGPGPEAVTYTVTFNLGEANGTAVEGPVPAAQTVAAGGSITLPNKGDLVALNDPDSATPTVVFDAVYKYLAGWNEDKTQPPQTLLVYIRSTVILPFTPYGPTSRPR